MIYIDDIIFSLQKFGGISTYFKHLSDSVKNSNIDAKALIFNDGNEDKDSSFYIQRKSRFLERFRTVDIPNSVSNNIVLHSSYYRYSKNNNVNNIISIYDFIYEKFETNLIKKKVHIYQKSKAISNSSAVICISESTKNDFLDYYPDYDPSKIFVTHLSHSSKSVENDSNYNFDDKFIKPYVLFVGMRSIHKNFLSCVEALKDINVEFKIVGGGGLNDLELKFLNKYVPLRYKYYSNIDNNSLNNLYQNAVCLLYPSYYEGFGLPILEAMANGCAVITSNYSSLPEVGGNACILLNNPSPVNLGESINLLLDYNSNLNYVRLGFINISRFSWENTCNNTFNIYKKFI